VLDRLTGEIARLPDIKIKWSKVSEKAGVGGGLKSRQPHSVELGEVEIPDKNE
jgi:hypothetical protein